MAEPATTGVWATHRDGVRTRIVDAYLDLSATSAEVSMPAVAERADVSVRTLYRYFPTKGDLRRDAAGWLDRRARAAMAGRSIEMSTLGEYLHRLWTELEAERPAVHAQHTTTEGREMRASRLGPARTQVAAGVPATVTGTARNQLVDLIVAMCSSSMFLELVDRMGYDAADASDLVARAVHTIIDHEAGRAAGREAAT